MSKRKATTRAVEEAQYYGCKTADQIRHRIGGGSLTTIGKMRHKLAKQAKGPALPPTQADYKAVVRRQGMLLQELSDWLLKLGSDPSYLPALLVMPTNLAVLAPTELIERVFRVSLTDFLRPHFEPVVLWGLEAKPKPKSKPAVKEKLTPKSKRKPGPES